MRLPKKTDSWQEALKFINRCPVCGATYEVDKAKLFSKNLTASLVHIPCTVCQSNFVVMILIAGHGLSSVGMVIDLNFEDVNRLHKSLPLTIDEIIRGYETMQDNYFLHSLILNG